MPRETIQLRRNVHVRYQGTDTALIVLCADMAQIRRNFEAAHRRAG